MVFLTHLINGISLGSIYAIIALGYTMVYGIAKMLNFAHGDVIMIGGYASLLLATNAGLNPVLTILLSIIICTVLGVTVEKVAYKPLRKATSLAVLITAIGVSYFLQNIALIIFGSDPKSYVSVIKLDAIQLFDGKISIKGVTILAIVVSVVIMVILNIFIKKSKTGRAMLAVSEDKDAAQLMGVNINRTISITFAIGSGLATFASILMFTAYPTLSPTSGAMPGIRAFVAAVFGGIGSIPGAMLGGIILGIIETLSKAYISTQLGDAILFLGLIVVLLVKPTGILGKKVNEKV